MYMSARIAISILLLCCLLPAQQEPKKEEKPFELETFYMAIMDRAQTFDGQKLAAIAGDRQKYWQQVADHGDFILGGPLAGAKDTLAGAVIFRAPDKAAAEKIAAADPAVQQGLWKALVLPWGTQKGVLQPLREYDPAVTYYLGFLKRGAKFSPEDSPERHRIQEAHLKNMGRLHEMGKLVSGGPFLEDTDLRGIFIFKTVTIEEANELTNTDPAVQAGRLRIELYEWKLPKMAFSTGK